MSIEKLVLQNRSYRAFDEHSPIPVQLMRDLVDLARKTASGMNKQPLRYRILSEKSDIDKMMQNCRFAAKLGIKLPPEGQNPTGFILIFIDREAGSPQSLALKDVGIAAQTILLGATEKGFGGCMLGSFNPQTLCENYDIPERFEPALAIALGRPAELVVLVDPKDGSIDYYRDHNGIHYVPKHKLDDVLI